MSRNEKREIAKVIAHTRTDRNRAERIEKLRSDLLSCKTESQRVETFLESDVSIEDIMQAGNSSPIRPSGKDDWEARKLTVRAARRILEKLGQVCDEADTRLLSYAEAPALDRDFSKWYAALESLVTSLPKDRR
jgi:hypothetical protein